jgi:hypothetical protein
MSHEEVLLQGLLQQASMGLGMQAYVEARHVRPTFQLKTSAPYTAPSYVGTFTRGRVVIGVPLPTPEDLPPTRRCDREQSDGMPLVVGPPMEQSCVEAVMEYLDLGFSISEADVESMLSDDS